MNSRIYNRKVKNLSINVDKLTYLAQRTRLFLAKGPHYYFIYSRWRLKRLLNTTLLKAAPLDDAAFLAQLDLSGPDLNEVKQAVEAGNYEAAETKLWAYFQRRTTRSFFFEPENTAGLVALIDERQQAATVRLADDICQNIFCLRSAEPVKFEHGIDWTHRPLGNIDWTWDLNRHAYFETLGRAYHYTKDEKYARKFRDLILDWLAHNPADPAQPNWSSVFEVAFRVNVWIWAFYYFRGAAAFDQATGMALLKGLLAHGRYLDTHLEIHVLNNHLLLEAKALAMLGMLFPEFKQAQKWQRRGLKVLYHQIKAQVLADGVHGELATLYHRIIAGQLLEWLVLLENNLLSWPQKITDLLGRMIEFELWITKPDGLPPLIGDSALEDTYLRFSAANAGPGFLGRIDLLSADALLDESTIWLLGPERIAGYRALSANSVCLNSRAFPEGGFFVMRQGQNSEAAYLIFDAGPFGYKPVPAHGHADALSFELYAYGQTFLVDPGVYATRLGDEWRSFFRGSQGHNTVVVDNQHQSILVDILRVDRPAQSKVHQWLTDDHFDFVDASHNGYQRLAEPVTHRRQIFFVKPEYWVIIDTLTGQGEHSFDLYYHLMPDLAVELEPGGQTTYAGHKTGSGLTITTLATHEVQLELMMGETQPIQGWVSFYSGQKQPAPTLRYRQIGPVPVQFWTVLYPQPAARKGLVAVSPVTVELEPHNSLAADSRLTGLKIETDHHLDYLVVDRAPTQTLKSFADYKTDAQLVYLRHQKTDNRLTKVKLHGGQGLWYQGQALLDQNALIKNRQS